MVSFLSFSCSTGVTLTSGKPRPINFVQNCTSKADRCQNPALFLWQLYSSYFFYFKPNLYIKPLVGNGTILLKEDTFHLEAFLHQSTKLGNLLQGINQKSMVSSRAGLKGKTSGISLVLLEVFWIPPHPQASVPPDTALLKIVQINLSTSLPST